MKRKKSTTPLRREEPRRGTQECVRHEPKRGFIAEWAVNIIILFFCTTTMVQAFVIPTGSMEDSLLIGDHLLVDKMAYAPADSISKHFLPYEQVKRGDIIVFRSPAELKTTLVKRCMGVPGDRIKLVNKEVYLNGKKLVEPYAVHKAAWVDQYRDNFPRAPNAQLSDGGLDMLEHHVVNGEVVVPPDHYFAMGDNRDNSLDSRYWGFVPRENIIGKPLIIFWSYDAPTEDLIDPTPSGGHLIDVVEHFFTKTRWRRTFMLIHGTPVGS